MNRVVSCLIIGLDKNQPLHGSKFKVHINTCAMCIVVLLEQTGAAAALDVLISLGMCTVHLGSN